MTIKTEEKPRRPLAMEAAMREVTHLCVLADCTIEEHREANRFVAKKWGWKLDPKPADLPPDY